ncbi:putative membrane protein [Azorhizobium caulinodans ORS 571]|uniref:Putative membrane protein n=2 Tax=Xanthobacteraceae TaxID=335928 RepID=A8IMV1_AZOC5|nr:putative membrane protein [Azorhizobium caulinodans ORS 571]
MWRCSCIRTPARSRPGAHEQEAPMPHTQPPPPRRSRRLIWLVLGTLVAWFPLLGVFAATEIASTLGCKVNEGQPQPCLFGGTDIGGLLYTLFTGGWFMLITAPFMLLTIVLWVGVIVRWLWRRLRPVR